MSARNGRESVEKRSRLQSGQELRAFFSGLQGFDVYMSPCLLRLTIFINLKCQCGPIIYIPKNYLSESSRWSWKIENFAKLFPGFRIDCNVNWPSNGCDWRSDWGLSYLYDYIKIEAKVNQVRVHFKHILRIAFVVLDNKLTWVTIATSQLTYYWTTKGEK